MFILVVGVILGTRAPRDQLSRYGCLVKDETTGQVLHYVEKPETFISDLISCGIYIFSNTIFKHIGKFLQDREVVYVFNFTMHAMMMIVLFDNH